MLDRAQALGDGLILLVYLKDVGHEVCSPALVSSSVPTC